MKAVAPVSKTSMLSTSCSFSYFYSETKACCFSFWNKSKNKSKNDKISIWKNQTHAGLHQVAKRILFSEKD